MPANLDILIHELHAEGFEVMVATSGVQALEVIGFQRPDLILLDVRMPGIDGFETYRRLRAMEGIWRTCPSSSSPPKATRRWSPRDLPSAASTNVTKPIQKEVLLALIRGRLPR